MAENPVVVPKISFLQSAKAMATTGSLNLLLFATPIGILSWALNWSAVLTFVFSLAALVPLAERLGYVTEQLATHTNDTIGGLLNATFGNATELIVALVALVKGQYRLVQLSLLGSILSNLLLVLGTAFLFGGLRNKTQKYGTISSQINSTLMMLSVMALLFPTVLTLSGEESRLGQLGLSRGTSLLLFLLYFAFLYFQLKTHGDLYESVPKEEPLADRIVTTSTSSSATEPATSIITTDLESPEHIADTDEHPLINSNTVGFISFPTPLIPPSTTATAPEDDDDDEEVDELGFWNCIVWLTLMTIIIAVLSEAISASIEAAGTQAHISSVFLSAIVLPIVGNAAEHAGAVIFAMKNKLDLSLGVAIGSSTQIALCVLPCIVLIGWMMNKDMDLNFGAYESICLFLSVVSVTFAIKDGTSNWLLGAALIIGYLIIALGFWSHTNESLK
jgi:Ca2+:H+ antiporter